MTTDKKWYHSKKFWTAALPSIVTVVDMFFFQITGQHLPVEALITLGSTCIAYLLIEGGLDAAGRAAARRAKEINPLESAVIRDLVLALIANHYDYKKAADSLGMHARDVIAAVVADLAEMMDPELAEDKNVKAEIARLVTKQFDQDQKLMEGAKLSQAVAGQR